LNEEKADYPMMTNIMKWVSITILLLAVLFRVASSQVLLAIVVCVSAVLLVKQAIHAERYSWAVIFVAICCAFQSDRARCPLWKQRTMAERFGSCNIRDGCSRVEFQT
jgi:hypothetical protein